MESSKVLDKEETDYEDYEEADGDTELLSDEEISFCCWIIKYLYRLLFNYFGYLFIYLLFDFFITITINFIILILFHKYKYEVAHDTY